MTDVALDAQITGEGPPLIILHGLLGSARNWSGIARELQEFRQSHALNLRNHGTSPWAGSMDYESMAGDVASYMERHGLPRCDVLGHSMGGKVAMRLALTRPGRVRRLIVVDIAPVSYTHESFSSYIAAMRRIDLDQVTRRADVDAALADSIPDTNLRAFLQQNLINQDGKFQWRANLPAIAANLPALLAFPANETPFSGPASFLAGERSDYIRPRDEPILRHYFPAARIIEIADTGHWPHADRPDRVVALIRQALEE
jgi:pimeloyl-ACP methyl ester carboxylesterase